MSNHLLNQSKTLSRSRFLRLLALGGGSAALLIATGSNAIAQKAKPLIVGTEGTYPPFSFKDAKTGELTGYDIDVVRAVAKRLGREVQFVPTQWKGILASLEAKRFDLVANQVGITPERQKALLFSTPYTISGSVIIVSNDNPKNIQGIADVKGKTVGTTQGSNHADAVKKAGANVKFYPGAAQVLTDLQNNRIDAGVNDRLFVLTELKKTNYKVKSVGNIFNKSEIAFAFNKSNAELRDQFNKALEELRKDGTLAKISKKWFGQDVSS